MAGRYSKPQPSPPGAVEDSELPPFQREPEFLFEIASADNAPAAPSARTRGSKPQPHYHRHRDRLRARFDEAGADALADYELLELMLFRTIRRQDTKPLAKRLIEAFGGLAGVLAAPAARIAEIDGAGPAVAHDLKLAHALFLRAQRGELSKRRVITSWSQLVSYCRDALAHEPREQFRALFLDAKNQLIADEVLFKGTVDQAPVYPREVARRALELSAAALIVVHNHPSGDPKPSAQDVAMTREIVAAVEAVGVKVHDHLVVGRQGVASFRTLGLL